MLITRDTLADFVPPSPLMPSDIAASYLQCHPRTLAEWRIDGSGPKYFRVGRRAFYRLTDLDAWLDAHAYRSTADEPQQSTSHNERGMTPEHAIGPARSLVGV